MFCSKKNVTGTLTISDFFHTFSVFKYSWFHENSTVDIHCLKEDYLSIYLYTAEETVCRKNTVCNCKTSINQLLKWALFLKHPFSLSNLPPGFWYKLCIPKKLTNSFLFAFCSEIFSVSGAVAVSPSPLPPTRLNPWLLGQYWGRAGEINTTSPSRLQRKSAQEIRKSVSPIRRRQNPPLMKEEDATWPRGRRVAI